MHAQIIHMKQTEKSDWLLLVEDLLRRERGREDPGRSRRRKRKVMGKEERGRKSAF